MNDLRERTPITDRWNNEQRFSRDILNKTCWVCQLFGSPCGTLLNYKSATCMLITGYSGLIQFQQRDGVAIDRDTETAADKQLYDYEVVPAGVLFDFKAIVDNAMDWQLGMLYLCLSAFEKGELTIGGGSSRGLGVIKLSLAFSSIILIVLSIIKYLT